jgi:hypothetical protein
MPDFHATSEVIYLFSLFFHHVFIYWSGFCLFLQDTAPAPLARTISYNIIGPISYNFLQDTTPAPLALGYQSPTLAQLMYRYATLDPTLTSSASDKRKAPSLVAPSAAKKKRTSKNFLFRSESFPS